MRKSLIIVQVETIERMRDKMREILAGTCIGITGNVHNNLNKYSEHLENNFKINSLSYQ